MKILRIYPNLPPIKGGMEQHIRHLSLYQRDLGHEVCIWYNRGERVFENDKRILSSIPVYQIRPRFLGFCLFYLAVCFRLFFKRESWDIIHIHGDWSSFIFAPSIKKLTSADKAFFSIHGAIDHYESIRKKLLFKTLKKADKVFCSGYSAHEFIKESGNSYFQPSGIRPLFFVEEKEKKFDVFTLVTVANLVSAKNPETLVELAERLPDINFSIIGKGPRYKTLKNLIQIKNLKNIELKGFLEPQAVRLELLRAHVFLLTSVKEGTPTAMLEAMATRLPLIVSDVGGISAILGPRQKELIVTDPLNLEEWIEKILLIKKEKSLLEEVSIENKHTADKYSWDNVALNITNQMLNA